MRKRAPLWPAEASGREGNGGEVDNIRRLRLSQHSSAVRVWAFRTLRSPGLELRLLIPSSSSQALHIPLTAPFPCRNAGSRLVAAGYRGSGCVLWHTADHFGDAATRVRSEG